MDIFRPTNAGVLFAGEAVHIAVHKSGTYRYTAQPIVGHGAAGRRSALQLACQRLQVTQAKVALALPEAQIKRHSVPIPSHRRRRERVAIIRLQIRRKLPSPASSWRYCLSGQKGSTADLVAANQSCLSAAKRLTAGTGLKVSAIIPTRDALRASRGNLPATSELPRTPAAQLCTALIIAARSKSTVNLVTSQSPTSAHRPSNHRQIGAVLAALLGCFALLTNLKLLPPRFSPAQLGEPHPPQRAVTDSAPSLNQPPAEMAQAPKATSANHPAIADEQIWADARRRNLPHWLDLITDSRPQQLWLKEVRFSGDQISLQAQATQVSQGHEYITLLSAAGLLKPHLSRLDNDTGATTLIITSASDPQLDPHTEVRRDPVSLSAQSAAIARQLKAHDITLIRLEHKESATRADSMRSRLNLGLLGDYTSIRAWLGKLATIEPLLGLENIWLRRANPLQVQVDIELTLFSARGNA